MQRLGTQCSNDTAQMLLPTHVTVSKSLSSRCFRCHRTKQKICDRQRGPGGRACSTQHTAVKARPRACGTQTERSLGSESWSWHAGPVLLGGGETTGKILGPHAYDPGGLFNALHSQFLIGEMEIITKLTAKKD